MGTNYYVESKPKCECCGRGPEELHIGKLSGGWCFSLHVIPEMNLNNIDDWKNFLVGKKIYDEYGSSITLPELIEKIVSRSWNSNRVWSDEEFRINHAQIGPNGLVRHIVDGNHCVGHGLGIWDYITGDFS